MTTSKWNMWAGVACLVIGSVAQLLQYLVTPISGGAETAKQLSQAAEHLSAMRWAMVLDVPLMLIIPAVLYIGLVAGSRTSRLAAIATGLTFVSMLGAIYLLASDVLLYEAGSLETTPGVSALVDAFQNNGVVMALVVFYLLGHLVGFVLLAVALWRTMSVPRWAAVALGLSPFFEFAGVGGDVKIVGIVGYVLVLAVCSAVAVALLRTGSQPAEVAGASVMPAPLVT